MLSVTSCEPNSFRYMLTAADDALPGFLAVEIKRRFYSFSRNTNKHMKHKINYRIGCSVRVLTQAYIVIFINSI